MFADSAMIAGAYSEALEGYRRAGRAAESRGDRTLLARAAVGVGLAALQDGDANDARRSLTRAVELDPASAAAHVGLGRYFTAIRRYRDAGAEFERAQALEPASAEPAYRLGMAYVQAGQQADAIRAFTRALERDPAHAPSREALKPLLEERYRMAGVPSEYASIIERSSVSRGELGVMLAVELGLNPDRPGWRSDAPPRPVPRDVEGAWGMTWLRAAVERGLIEPYPDGSLHLGDPVTRGSLAILMAGIEYRWLGVSRTAPPGGPPGADGAVPDSLVRFADLGPRHYLAKPAARAVALGLPTREGGRFEAQAAATGWETLHALRSLARRIGAVSVLPPELATEGVVK